MSKKISFIIITLCIGGFLFGFDFAWNLFSNQTIEILSINTDLSASTILLATMLGSIFGAIISLFPLYTYGRKRTLILSAFLLLISSFGSANTLDSTYFILFRIVSGISLGIASVVFPVYIIELSKQGKAGINVLLFQVPIIMGLIVAFVYGNQFDPILEFHLQSILIQESNLSAFYILMVLFIPESPKWLIIKVGDPFGARKILLSIRSSSEEVKKEIESISLFKRQSDKRFINEKITLNSILQFFSTLFILLSGVYAILFYSPKIYLIIGFASDYLIIAIASTGIFFVIGTLLIYKLINYINHQFLLNLGMLGLTIVSLLIAIIFYSTIGYQLLPFLIFSFVLFFALSQGVVIWIMISAISRTYKNTKIASYLASLLWVSCILICLSMPNLNKSFGPTLIFAFFAFMMIFQTLIVLKMKFKSKSASLESIK